MTTVPGSANNPGAKICGVSDGRGCPRYAWLLFQNLFWALIVVVRQPNAIRHAVIDLRDTSYSFSPGQRCRLPVRSARRRPSLSGVLSVAYVVIPHEMLFGFRRHRS